MASETLDQDQYAVIFGGTIVTPERAPFLGSVTIRQGKIVKVAPAESTDPSGASRTMDATGHFVMPGLIDLHIHGAGGHDPSLGGIRELSSLLPRHGVTGFLPTILPSEPRELAAIIAALAGEMRAVLPGAKPLGIHLEGPYLSPAQPGCLDPKHFRLPDTAELKRLVTRSRRTIKRMTLAIELPGAPDLLSQLWDNGIAASLGHSEASFEATMASTAQGLVQATHTFNAMPRFHHRTPGAIGAVLYCREILAEVIADGQHVHPAAIELLYRLKGPANIALVSDAIPPAGLPAGRYEWEGKAIEVAEGACRTVDGHLAGSGTLLDGALRFLTRETGIPLVDAVTMATLTPAFALDIGEITGSIAPGKAADLAIFDREWRCRATMVDGRVVYEA